MIKILKATLLMSNMNVYYVEKDNLIGKFNDIIAFNDLSILCEAAKNYNCLFVKNDWGLKFKTISILMEINDINELRNFYPEYFI